jgi:hypothetical protein
MRPYLHSYDAEPTAAESEFLDVRPAFEKFDFLQVYR